MSKYVRREREAHATQMRRAPAVPGPPITPLSRGWPRSRRMGVASEAMICAPAEPPGRWRACLQVRFIVR